MKEPGRNMLFLQPVLNAGGEFFSSGIHGGKNSF